MKLCRYHRAACYGTDWLGLRAPAGRPSCRGMDYVV
jgi:hypothetical protein